MKLRWLHLTIEYQKYDERSKESKTYYTTHDPVLQFWNGEEWMDVPVEKIEIQHFPM